MGIAAKKTVVLNEPERQLTTPQATWNNVEWNEAIQDKGYVAYIEHSLECPCGTQGNTTASPECVNCGGTGRFWIDKTKTIILCQGMNNATKYTNWTAENMGIVRISTTPTDKLGFMSKVILAEVESIFNQKLYLRKPNAGGNWFGFTTYNVLQVYDCYLFQGDTSQLKVLYIDIDFTISDNRIILDSKYNSLVKPRITLRYLHNPIYFILESNRDLIRQKILNSCEKDTDNPKDNMPLSFTGKLAQFLPELLNFDGTGTLDNTDYTRTPIDYNYK